MTEKTGFMNGNVGNTHVIFGTVALLLLLSGSILCNLAHINFPQKIDGDTSDERDAQRQQARDEEDMSTLQYGLGLVLFNTGIGVAIGLLLILGFGSAPADGIPVKNASDFLRALTSSGPRAMFILGAVLLASVWITFFMSGAVLEKLILLH